MVMVGAFPGGSGGKVPAGFGSIHLQWTTVDRLNISGASFTLVSADYNETVLAGEDGRAITVVPVGTYTISVNHSGDYDNDAPQNLIVESTQTYYVTFEGIMKSGGVEISNLEPNAAYELIDSTGSILYSGSSLPSVLTLPIDPGEYTLKLSLYGDTVSKSFTALASTVTKVSTDDLYCKLNIVNSSPFTIKNLLYNGTYTLPLSSSIRVLISSSSKYISGDIVESYGNLKTDSVATFGNHYFTPSTATQTVTLTATGRRVFLTQSGTLIVPIASRFRIFAIGGGGAEGGGAPYAGGGGGGGHVAESTVSVSAGEYSITIGEGATQVPGSDPPAGGATSFGTLVSASGGGSSYSDGAGGSGGSGGGSSGGSSETGQNQSVRKGGSGDYAGGGGGGGSIYSGDLSEHGPYGGAGGGGGIYTGLNTSSAEAGVSLSDSFYGSAVSPTAGSAGTGYGAGGGGGGGRGAKGGNGGNGYATTQSSINYQQRRYGGGGGGGGIAGGNGGNGGNYSESDSSLNPGKAGIGYGAGGGGRAMYYRNSSTYTGTRSGGGGGGGGLSSTQVATDGSGETSGNGGKGAIIIQWVSA